MGADLRQQLRSAAFSRFAEEHRGQAQARANGFLDDPHTFDRAKPFRGAFSTRESAAQFLDQRMLAAVDAPQATATRR